MADLKFRPEEIRSHRLASGSSGVPEWVAEFVSCAQEAAERGESVKVTFEREMLTTSQAAERLSLDKSTVWRMVQDGRLKAEKVGSHYRIPAEEVRRHDQERMSNMAKQLSDELAADLLDG
ncbi:helix-turn-helix domain-containing protein [Nesterenkonia sphaerica]|uniref:Helix-turn-helix domain-containing protein n=1 Tax=Nesterenkonia sphaerica TaxID=1804988 RepID=A0A5R9ANB9_9MICC|nr:helix-turn-helix domain-containing protein [Nesterenkonia sphaerica]TLP79327.1 helix-turn-helix domain-containing protein [Nesterenkonia sphaerica]